MSWLEEQYTEGDSSSNRIKAINRKIANKWFDKIPADEEGSEGEVRYVMNSGLPLMCVKMNQEWHFTTLQTVGKRGVVRMGDGIDASSLINYMPNEPHWDSGWRQLVMPGTTESGGTTSFDWEWGGGGTYNGMSGEQVITQGAFWENVGTVYAEHMGGGATGAQTNYSQQVYLVNHGLGLTKPPKNVACFLCNAPPYASWSVDTVTTQNCLQPGGTYATTEEAVEDGISTFFTSFRASETAMLSDNIALSNRSIIYGNMGIGQKFDSYITPSAFGMNSQFSSGSTVSVIIISPNEMIMIPQWIFVQSYDSGNRQNLEWLRLYVWR